MLLTRQYSAVTASSLTSAQPLQRPSPSSWIQSNPSSRQIFDPKRLLLSFDLRKSNSDDAQILLRWEQNLRAAVGMRAYGKTDWNVSPWCQKNAYVQILTKFFLIYRAEIRQHALRSAIRLLSANSLRARQLKTKMPPTGWNYAIIFFLLPLPNLPKRNYQKKTIKKEQRKICTFV